jgi:hypothetical protein
MSSADTGNRRDISLFSACSSSPKSPDPNIVLLAFHMEQTLGEAAVASLDLGQPPFFRRAPDALRQVNMGSGPAA